MSRRLDQIPGALERLARALAGRREHAAFFGVFVTHNCFGVWVEWQDTITHERGVLAEFHKHQLGEAPEDFQPTVAALLEKVTEWRQSP